MEEREVFDFGFAAMVGGASGSDSRTENPEVAEKSPMAAASVSVVKRKRGRPRRHALDGAPAQALSPMPISSSIPLSGEFSAPKRGRGRLKKFAQFEHGNLVDRMAYLDGADFMPHVITVNAGEDVNLKAMSFSQQRSRAISILSATGMISNVTLRQSSSSGGTLTYEGRFEILSMSGSYMPPDRGTTKSRSGGLSVSLAGPDGRVMGGGLAGMLIAACPVQVVVGSFLPCYQMENKRRKSRIEPKPIAIASPANVHPDFSRDDPACSNPIPVFRTTSEEDEDTNPSNREVR